MSKDGKQKKAPSSLNPMIFLVVVMVIVAITSYLIPPDPCRLF